MTLEKLIFLLHKRLVYGKKVKQVSLTETRKLLSQLEPVVFLSTGRCGTKWIDEMIGAEKTIVSIHHPDPVMRSQAALAYRFDFEKSTIDEKALLREMFLSGREEIFMYTLRANKNLVITDSRNTFFAQVLLDLCPKTKFVHLHRHVGEVIRSGMRRGWYEAENDSELNRIRPLEEEISEKEWNSMDAIEKNAWLWSETNQWIEGVINQLPEEQVFRSSFNNWNSEHLASLFEFCGASFEKKNIEKKKGKKINVQNSGDFPKYENWSTENKAKVKQFSGLMADKLGYEL